MNKTFNFNGTALRTHNDDGQLWFAASDVCRCLGFPIGGVAGGTHRYLKRLDADERKTVRKCEAIFSPLFKGTTAPALTLVTESGLYKLVMRSGKVEALAFQNWIAREVLPAIRKTGGYLLNENAREVAHADERTEMPLPAEFKAFFERMLEAQEKHIAVLDAMMQRLLTDPAVPAEVKSAAEELFAREYSSSRQVADALKLAGAHEGPKEYQKKVVALGRTLSLMTKAAGLKVKQVPSNGYTKALYPAEVVKAYADSLK